ncbi:hypothetical protein Egran_07103 [Elaphomyces granulatus]|uniref:Uncharacterized protein n=1 Tax=Elaphomyces granulatus TaxID=519963 RepID=A0A232LLU1_9EURO|nr:hypothetical protein Egran_07103 [Elaphomyces granulatus]
MPDLCDGQKPQHAPAAGKGGRLLTRRTQDFLTKTNERPSSRMTKNQTPQLNPGFCALGFENPGITKSIDGSFRTWSVRSIAWSPDGWYLASGSDDSSIRVWRMPDGTRRHTLAGHTDHISCVTWEPSGAIIASASYDNTIRLWDSVTGRQIRVLEGHTGIVRGICFTRDGKLLISKSADNTIRIWRCDTWEVLGFFDEPTSGALLGLSIHPTNLQVATLNSTQDRSDRSIRLWSVNVEKVFANAPKSYSVHYTNAKVVLVGDSSVGKTGLGIGLTGQTYQKTDSTHGRQVWTLETEEPGYRLVHQLHLNEVAVALVVFDGKRETDPFGGVRHWDRVLKQSHLVQDNAGLPLKKFLVAARTDRGSIGVSQERIDALVKDMGFEGYFVTSAKENYNIKELGDQIRACINWELMPKVTSRQMFHSIKSSIISSRKSGIVLTTKDEMYSGYVKSDTSNGESNKSISQFETCLGLVEAQGFVRRLGFGGLILLKPEILDAYASALVNAAKDEPDGMGCIANGMYSI